MCDLQANEKECNRKTSNLINLSVARHPEGAEYFLTLLNTAANTILASFGSDLKNKCHGQLAVMLWYWLAAEHQKDESFSNYQRRTNLEPWPQKEGEERKLTCCGVTRNSFHWDWWAMNNSPHPWSIRFSLCQCLYFNLNTLNPTELTAVSSARLAAHQRTASK